MEQHLHSILKSYTGLKININQLIVISRQNTNSYLLEKLIKQLTLLSEQLLAILNTFNNLKY